MKRQTRGMIEVLREINRQVECRKTAAALLQSRRRSRGNLAAALWLFWGTK